MTPARLAVVGPFTGPRAAWGRLLLDAAGRAATPAVAPSFVDDEGDAAVAERQALAVVRDGGFRAVVGHFNSLGAARALPVYRAAGLPAVLPLATAAGLLDGSGGWALRWCPDDAAQAQAIAAALGSRGHRSCTVRDDGSAYGRRLAGLVAGALPAPTGPVTATVLCGTHHGVARLVGSGVGQLVVTDDCDVPEFAALAGPAAAGALVARLAGGAAGLVDAAVQALVGALAAAPDATGRDLLAAVRATAGRGFGPDGDPLDADWEVVPLPARTVPRRAPSGRSTDRYDVAVVGTGIVGAGVAARLAEAGASVVTVDRGIGASAWSGALVRAYEPEPDARALAVRSTQLVWGDPDAARGYGFRRTGSVVLLGPDDLGPAARAVDELAAAGIRAALLPPAEIARRWPAMSVAGVAGGLWEPGGGYADPIAAVSRLRARARCAGALHLTDRRVRGIDPAPGGAARLRTARGPLDARVVVVAAGAGTPALLADRPAAAGLRTKGIRYAFFPAPTDPLPAVLDLVTGAWARPAPDGRVLVGSPVEDWDVAPAGGDLTPDRAGPVRSGGVTRWPWLADARLLGGRHGVDLYAPAGPVHGVLAGAPPVAVAAGWSGGGFKTAPAAAERTARDALDLLAAAR